MCHHGAAPDVMHGSTMLAADNCGNGWSNPTLRRGDIVVMDNLSAHKVSGIEAMIAAAGAELIYLPPYSPDWSPIESCWSKIKTHLRGMKARTRDALDKALAKVINKVSNSDARGWFAHCGYSLH